VDQGAVLPLCWVFSNGCIKDLFIRCDSFFPGNIPIQAGQVGHPDPRGKCHKHDEYLSISQMQQLLTNTPHVVFRQRWRSQLYSGSGGV